MTRMLDAGLVDTIVDFVERRLLPHSCSDYAHDHTSAGELGCELLEALGHARRTLWGADRLDHPVPPDVLPRWDDTCLAVLSVAARDHLFGSGEYPFVTRTVIHRDPFGRSYAATAEVLCLLERLGAVEGGSWTADAEPVLWRHLDLLDPLPAFDGVPRLVALADRSVATQPEDVVRDIAPARSQDTLFLRRLHVMDVVARRWRYPEGWLPRDGSEPRPLYVHHDALALWMALRLT